MSPKNKTKHSIPVCTREKETHTENKIKHIQPKKNGINLAKASNELLYAIAPHDKSQNRIDENKMHALCIDLCLIKPNGEKQSVLNV